MLASEEHAADLFTRFVASFTPDDRPEMIFMSGGEPLLRPKLVLELAERAHAVGCRSQVLSGMFFARSRRIPAPIRRAIDEVDLFSASLDVFHEQEVSRADVFRVLDELLAAGKDVSLQVVGLDDDDPYLADVTEDIRRTFDDRVPVLVGHVGPSGRAGRWLKEESKARPKRTGPEPSPCTLAGWPLVCFDGTVVACCNQDVVDGPAPEHLRLGHTSRDSWPTVRRRFLTSSMLRAIRLFGPEYLADRHSTTVGCDGYCSTCMKLSTDPELPNRVDKLFERQSMRVLEERVRAMQSDLGPVGFARRFGSPRYAELVSLGASPVPEELWVA